MVSFFDVCVGEVMVMGECILVVVIDVLVLGCMVVGEVIINFVVVFIK